MSDSEILHNKKKLFIRDNYSVAGTSAHQLFSLADSVSLDGNNGSIPSQTSTNSAVLNSNDFVPTCATYSRITANSQPSSPLTHRY